MKKRTLLLNISLIFGIVYHLLFIAGYLLQKPLLGWQYPLEIRDRLEPVYCMPIIVVTAVCGIAFAVLVLMMRKNTSCGLFIGTVVFSGVVFVGERIANALVSLNNSLLNKLIAEKGELGPIVFSLNSSTVKTLDMFLLPLFVAAIVLMCCAWCVKEEAVSQIGINGSV